VTVFGRVDAWLGTTKDTVTGVSTNKLDNGGLTGSRWGLRGTEDLGGGLKAVFNVENRFSVDTGTDTGGFLGNAYVGLEGGFGAVHLGRTYTAYDGIKAISVGSSVFDSAFTPNALPAYAVRGANGVKYVSPSFSGLTVAANVALSEVNGTSNESSVGLTYAAGPLTVGVGFESNRDGISGGAAGKNTVISGAYNFGVASVSAGYGTFNGTGAANDKSGYNIGVTVPMDAFKFSVGFADGKTETTAGAKVDDFSGWGMGVTYSLSKRTTAYAGYSDVRTKNAAGVKTAGTRLYAVGIRHDF